MNPLMWCGVVLAGVFFIGVALAEGLRLLTWLQLRAMARRAVRSVQENPPRPGQVWRGPRRLFYAKVLLATEDVVRVTTYRADSYNIVRLQRAFPDAWAELQARYDAPGGLLPGERDSTTCMSHGGSVVLPPFEWPE